MQTPSVAELFCQIEGQEDFFALKENYQEYLQSGNFFVIGSGSNVVFKNEQFAGLIIHLVNKKVQILEKQNDFILLKVDAGFIWDDLVGFSINKGAYGLENLSLIPGTVGASAVQNIGAYGTEAKDFIYEVEYFDLIKGQFVVVDNTTCEFSYRNSVFKKRLKNKAIISSVVFKLFAKPKINIEYQALKSYVEKNAISENPQNIRQAIIEIRTNKLPDPNNIPNSGSFFKNPIILKESAEILKQQYPKMPIYPIDSMHTKLAAGWLIEQAGWKAKQIGNVAVYKDQALVIVNRGGATGNEIYDFAQLIKQAVLRKFNVFLEEEVIYL